MPLYWYDWFRWVMWFLCIDMIGLDESCEGELLKKAMFGFQIVKTSKYLSFDYFQHLTKHKPLSTRWSPMTQNMKLKRYMIFYKATWDLYKSKCLKYFDLNVLKYRKNYTLVYQRVTSDPFNISGTAKAIGMGPTLKLFSFSEWQYP